MYVVHLRRVQILLSGTVQEVCIAITQYPGVPPLLKLEVLQNFRVGNVIRTRLLQWNSAEQPGGWSLHHIDWEPVIASVIITMEELTRAVFPILGLISVANRSC